ncbi:MAG: LytTR family DNA-binding domain-containing protein [Chitinophagaceae bacterium]
MHISKQAITIPIQKGYERLKLLQVPKKTQWRKLAITLSDEVRFIPFDDIIYCKSTSNYTTIFTTGDTSYLCCKTLKDIESKLPDDLFIRIHHSYLVNMHFITSLIKQKSELEIDNRLLLPISQTKKADMYKLFNL